MKNIRVTLTALALLAANLFAVSAVHAQSPVKGENVKSIIYLKDGRLGGLMAQGPGKTWIENNDDGRFVFRELARDEWSVYLLKRDGAMVQIDLHTRKFYFVYGPLSPEEMRNPALALKRKTPMYNIAKAYH